MKEAIRKRAEELGFDICRFTTAAAPANAGSLRRWLEQGQNGEMAYLARNAAKRSDPQLILPGAESVICVAANYFTPESQCNPRPPENVRGVIARYARSDDYHTVLGTQLKALADFLDQLVSGARSLWYVDTGPILERDIAQRAGVGFIGKHTNVISRKFGNWLLLGEILTTIKLAPDTQETNRCGACTRCIEACPTRAITAPFQLDARLCISYLTIELKGAIPFELRPLIGNRIFGCDDCLAVCPWNRFAHAGRFLKTFARGDLETPDLINLLGLDEIGFRTCFRNTPILRAKRRGLLRNVCVALGNVGDKAALPALLNASRDPEPLIAEHANWAINEIETRNSTP